MQKTDRRKRREAEAALRRFESVSDKEVIAAVDRAERHRPPDRRNEPGVPWMAIIDHFGFVNTGWTTRQLRPQLEGLVAGGMLETSRRHNRTYWTLTGSDAWFELKEHLSRRLWRVGSVTHCLYEWQEPDDATADADDRENPGDERLRRDAQSRLHGLISPQHVVGDDASRRGWATRSCPK